MNKLFLKRNKMKAFFIFLLCFYSVTAVAGNQYPVAAIPASLLKDAHVVKRMEEIRFEIVSLRETVHKRKYALTILDQNGQGAAGLVVGYDKLIKVSSIEGTLYDATGVAIRKVKGKDIKDMSAVQDISLFDDNRMKVHDFDYHNYPYTVEYEVELQFNHTYYFPTWMPQNHENLAVEKSSYTFVCPENYTPRSKAFHYAQQPAVAVEKGKKLMTWQVTNMSAITKPYAAPKWNELTTTVYFSPSEFEMQGYKASAASWQELGKFQLLLNQNRDQLPAPVVEKIGQLTQHLKDPKEKVKTLYEYLQQNTRYISIQLGIGGLQPFEASYVAQKGYGDCKALSNYMYSMLKAVGIKSYYSWIQGGRDVDDRYIMEDFPSDQFNHIVLCVPFEKDTMWLECTSQTDPAGYMGGFTGNRKALVITEDGGKLVSTPRYGLEENLQQRTIKATLNNDGNLLAEVKTIYKAQQQDYVYSLLHSLSKEKVKTLLNESFDFSTYDINDFAYSPKKAVLPEVEEKLQLTVSGYATVSGRRLFILPNLMTRNSKKAISPEDRTNEFVFDYAYRDVDSVEITLPEGYTVESIPAEGNLKTPYGNYTSSVKVNGTKLTYFRKIEQHAGRFPAKEAAAIADFYTTIYKNDRSRVVLVKKEG
jgi:hypothetical protein